MKKRILATLLAVVLLTTTTLTGTVPVQAARSTSDAEQYVMLDGEWSFKLYRTYANMFQYFPYSAAIAAGKWTDAEAAVYPADGVWEDWDTVNLPADDPETGGLLSTDIMPSWSEAWVVREFDLPEDFTDEDTVTLLMGIIDDNDVVYINGTAVAASGFVDGAGNPIIDVPETGGFVYDKNAAAEDQVKWSKSYWEIQREYTIPADVLNLGDTNEIAIRLYNNNGFGGFYSGNTFAICGNDLAVRTLKGLPTEIAESSEVEDAVAAQIEALESGDMDAYAETISKDYHNDADEKADKVDAMEALVGEADEVTVEDTEAAIYVDDEGNYWYSAQRVITGDGETLFSGSVELCFEINRRGDAVERGNWNRCYGTSYASDLFGTNLTYSVYLPPSYYENEDQEYPTVWLLHGRASSSTSYRDVDNIAAFMDEMIADGEIGEMVLIMPDSGKYAFYEDSTLGSDKDQGGPWRSQLTEELREVAETEYRLMSGAEFHGLTGNSMGAYGSIMAGTTRPDLYSSIGLHMGHLPSAALESLKSLTMDELDGYDFYLDAGLQDATVGYAGTVAIHEYLDSVGKEHGYDLRDGGHNSAFYMEGMVESMKMHSKHFYGEEADSELSADAYVELDGEWSFNLYRTYSNMFQYMPYAAYGLFKTTWEDNDIALYPADGVWQDWDTVSLPSDDPETGGLLSTDIMPSWSEAWAVREFDLPEDFATGNTATLLMGIIDDNDVIYINGTAVASSGLVDGKGQPVEDVADIGGFVTTGAAEDQIKWSKSYWEIQRVYTIPTDVLNQGGTNEIAIRLYNNNGFGGFYSGNTYAICGNDLAVRALNGLPTELADEDDAQAVLEAVQAQYEALVDGDLDAYADTISDDYHNDADDKDDKLAQAEEYLELYAEDKNVAVYVDEDGYCWYSADRVWTDVDYEEIYAEKVELCFEINRRGDAVERGNWNRCYGTSYASDLFGTDLTYSVYLPPSYYENEDQEYPTVWLLHGRASSSTSYRDVDNIASFMDEMIADGEIGEMVLIMPDSGKYAFYEDSTLGSDKDQGGPWRSQLTEELREVAESEYRLMSGAEFHGLTGNSMGAYGSIMAGTTRPDLYSSIGLHMGHLPSAALESLQSLTMDELAKYDFYLDAGLQDATVGYAGTVAIHEYLDSVDKEHGYDLRDGGHNSAFYMEGMVESMKMHSDHFQGNMIRPEDDPDAYVELDGEWNFNLYRTYSNMFQYMPYAQYGLFKTTWEDNDVALYPADGVWADWDVVSMPTDDPETGGLLSTDIMPSWSEAWVVRQFDLPEDFTDDDTVTLLMGIIDDNDVVYINGTAVAASGFINGNNQPVADVAETGGFVTTGAAEDQIKWSKSYWEIQREYTVPADLLNLGGTNEIAIRLYNNNGFGGFYSGNTFAICGNDLAVRALKGLPTEIAESTEVEEAVAAQIEALADGDLDAYADTISDDYHNDADDKADKLDLMESKLGLSAQDLNATIYVDDEGCYWYSAERDWYDSEGNYLETENVEICFVVEDGVALERGNWNRCYGTSYNSELFGQGLTYSVYLPPSYYENEDQEYPTVWLLHGRASSSTSYRDVDNIASFMDEMIADGEIGEMVLIMPDSGKYAFYEDSELGSDKDQGGPWRTQLTEELREVAESEYRLMSGAAFHGLTGNSMGAYGSIMAGTTRPDLYSSIGLHMGHLPTAALESLQSLTMDELAKYDFYLDAGLQDATVGYAGTVAIHEYLDSVDKEHGYDLRDGGHNSAFYMEGMVESMKMHSDHFQKGFFATVRYDSNGGPDVPSETIDLREQTTFTQPDVPRRWGYEFEGWFCDEDLTEEYDFSSQPAGGDDMMLYAKWTKKSGTDSGVIRPSSGGSSSSADDAIYVTVTEKEAKAGTVTLDIEPVDSKDTVKITVSTQAVVEIPVANMTPGTVVVLVDSLGRETVVSTTGMTEDSVVVSIPGSVTVKVMDKSKLFSDVMANSWFKDAVAFVSARGMMNGVGNGEFGHGLLTSRAMVAQLLHNIKGNPAPEGSDYYADVQDGQWFADAMNWAGEQDMLVNAAENANPDEAISREELAVMLWKFSGSEESDYSIDYFTDAQAISQYAQAALRWAVENGLMSGRTDGSLDPTGNATRAEVASVMMMFYKNVLY